MTDERRYDDAEISEIFEHAAGADDAGVPTRSSGTGLTLSELQEIGGEVGLSAERIARAAHHLDVGRGSFIRRTALGLPISVGRAVELPRPLTDEEWNILVGELRETFQARGNVLSHGDLREWTNGNLHVFIEATDGGHRIRLRTTKGSAVAMQRAGAGMTLFAFVLMLLFVVAGEPGGELLGPLVLGLIGAGALGSNVLTLPRWAREREEQMAYIAARAVALAERDPEP